jgi:RNA polymerase sigma factor (sigma-70 family)
MMALNQEYPMPLNDANSARAGSGGQVFATTHWSIVLRVGDGQSHDATQALEELCRTYWYPLYAFVRYKGHTHEEAQDLTQAFFAKLLEKNQISLADPARGRFRTFLLRSLENFLRTEHRDATTQKRGGGREIVSWDANAAAERYSSDCAEETSPTVVFERQWAAVLLESVLDMLRQEFSQSGKAELFEQLEPHLWEDETSSPYPRIAEALNMTGVSVRVTVHRLRRRFHELLRAQIAHTVESVDDVDDELRYLRRLWAK